MNAQIPACARVKEVTHALGIGRTTLWRWIRDGHFPQPVRLGPRRIVWRWSDVNEFLESRLADREAA